MEQINPESTQMPQRYLVAAKGKKRTVKNILDYVRSLKGDEYLSFILRKFQVRSSHFLNPDEEINNHFICDLLEILSERGFSPQMILKMGEASFDSIKDTKLGRIFSSYQDVQSLYEGIFYEHVEHFDLNFDYTICSFSRDQCVVQVRQNDEIAELLNKKKIGSHLLSFYKSGVISSFTKYLSLSTSKVRLTKCAHLGDSFCEYEISFPRPPSSSHMLH